jgi:hypothetical protein
MRRKIGILLAALKVAALTAAPGAAAELTKMLREV